MAKAKRKKAPTTRRKVTPEASSMRAAAPVKRQLEQSVKALLRFQPSEIETLLGQQLAMTTNEMEKSSSLSAITPATTLVEDRAQLAGAPEWLRQLGQRFLKKLSAQMYAVLCDKDDPDNAKVREAAAAGAEKLALVLAGYLVASLALMPAIATAVAVIIAKRVLAAGHEALCEQLKETLPT